MVYVFDNDNCIVKLVCEFFFLLMKVNLVIGIFMILNCLKIR